MCACPFHLDIRGFLDKAGRKRWIPAYKALRDAVVFPVIVAALCDQPCRERCQRTALGDEAIALRVVTKMDSVSRDWVMMQESVCKDTLVRKVTPPEVYTKVSMCLRTALISQRTIVETMRAPSREAIYKSDDALAAIRTDTMNCQKDAVYNSYAKTELSNDDVAQAREALGAARAYAALAEKKSLAAAILRGTAAARRAGAPRLLADVLVEESERLIRFDANPTAARAVADEIIGIAQKDGYDAGIAAGNHERGFAENAAGNNTDALEWYKHALDVKERIFGKEHPETARTYNAVGIAHLDLAELDVALDWFKRALVIRERALGKDHPQTAASYNNIGNAYLGRGDSDEAILWYKRAIDVKERVLGKDHPSTAASYTNLGGAYQKKGAHDEALRLFRQALAIQERVLGADHPEAAASMNNIGYAYETKGELAQAIMWYRRADAIYTAKLGESHPKTVQVRGHIKSACAKVPQACAAP